MGLAGITRINIIDDNKGRGAVRLDRPKEYWPIANQLYRDIFKELKVILLPEDETIECTKEEFQAGYDYILGIDLVLRSNDSEFTMQEKFLFSNYNTVTVEHCQDWLTLEKGDFYNIKAQYYFVGYDDCNCNHYFNPWILLDWPRLKRATSQYRVHWKLRGNDVTKVGARASFLYADFGDMPPEVIVSSSNRSYSYL